jgi:hypothetical protein
MDAWQVVALGCAGGALPDVLRVIERRHKPMPAYLKRGFFWFGVGLLMALGGGASYLMEPSRPIDALAIGFSAPAIISSLLASKHPPPERTFHMTTDYDILIVPFFEAYFLLGPLRKWWAGASEGELAT